MITSTLIPPHFTLTKATCSPCRKTIQTVRQWGGDDSGVQIAVMGAKCSTSISMQTRNFACENTCY